MKRKMSIFLTGLVAISLLAGCTSSGTEVTEAPSVDESVTDSSANNSDSTNKEDSYDIMEFAKDVYIDETVLYDKDDLKIIAKELECDSYSVTLKLAFENNTDKKYEFIAESSGYSVNAVNGYMIEDGYCYVDVEPQTTEEDEIEFSVMELMLNGIWSIADIEVGFNIEDEDYNSVYTGPLKITTPLAASYNYDNDNFKKAITGKILQNTYGFEVPYFGEEEIYSSNGISIVSEAYVVNKDGNRIIMLEVKNDTDSTISFVTSNISANGTNMYDGRWSYDVITPGNKMIIDIFLDRKFDESEWEAKGITEIENIGFDVEIRNVDGLVIADPASVVVNIK